MLSKDFHPIVVVPIVTISDDSIRFLHQKTQIDIQTKYMAELRKILECCSGYYTIPDISEKTGVSTGLINAILEQLTTLEVVVDSRKQYLHFHRISNYPTGFSRKMTRDAVHAYTTSPRVPVQNGTPYNYTLIKSKLNSILCKRHSCRAFSDQILSVDVIGSICNYGYSIKDHRVPSGGALYPLKLFVLVERNQHGLLAGYYEYDAEKDLLVRFSDTVDVEQLCHCFNTEKLAFGASIQIIIAADLERQSYKYGNRGYRLTLLEVGHVAENIMLFCAEQGLDTCELGGLLDDPLRTELQMKDEVYPITAIAIGYADPDPESVIDEIAFLENNLDQFTWDIQKTTATIFSNSSCFFGATIKYGNDDSDIAGATSLSYSHAVFKANIEAYERKKSGDAHVDFDGTAIDLQRDQKIWINPDTLAPLTVKQSEQIGLIPFSEDLPIQWTSAFSYRRKCQIYLPTDVVYYGHRHGKNCIYIGNSSGVAAHINKNIAREKALTELLERDAIMRSWYRQEPPFRLTESCLPIHAKKRVDYFRKKGRNVFVLDMPSKYAKVILTVIVSDDYPCFVCGAAATINHSSESLAKTISKAFQEAEYCLYSCLKYPDQSNIEPASVCTPRDHGKLYHFAKYKDCLKWLWTGNLISEPLSWNSLSFEELSNKMDLIEVALSDEAPIYVIRMLSPKLVPISFGYYNTHYTHPALEGNYNNKSLLLPHFFA